MDVNLPIETELLRPEVAKIMLESGITVRELVKHGKEGLNASKDIKDRDGDLVDTVPDWNVRHKYWNGFMEMFKLLHGPGVTINQVAPQEKKDEEAAALKWRLPVG